MTTSTQQTQQQQGADSRKAAVGFVVLLGVLSLFSDMTYEGARSISGPFLASLGASGTVVGIVAGGGELLAYGLRVVSGYVSDRTGRYWLMTYLGYALNLLAVPALALAGRWEIAALLLLAERTGKAIRTPARDAMLSHATSRVGHGWGFALHEAMDQIGAVAGPLLAAYILSLNRPYAAAFRALLIPALLALGILTYARIIYPRPGDFEPAQTQEVARSPMPQMYWLYIVGVALVACGFADFPLIAFHLSRTTGVSSAVVAAMYAMAMGVDACSALFFGWLYDRIKVTSLAIAVGLSSVFAPLCFLGGLKAAMVGVALWGVGMGAQESIMRAVVPSVVPRNRRATAYGILNAVYGLAWFAGSALMGYLYDVSLTALVAFSLIMQVGAVVAIVRLARVHRAAA